MELRTLGVWGVFLMAVPACTGDTTDSVGDADADTDADTDTDTDTDADTDTDTDADVAWHADTISVGFEYLWDEDKGLEDLDLKGKVKYPYFVAVMYNHGKYEANSESYPYCQVWYDFTGAEPHGSFGSDYWMSFDMTGVTIEGSDGHCDSLESFMQIPYSGDLQAFMDSFEWGIGVEHVDNVSKANMTSWETAWGKFYEASRGAWSDNLPYWAGASFTNIWVDSANGGQPAEVGLVYSFETTSDNELATDKSGYYIAKPLQSKGIPVTGYYTLLSMYSYGTGF